MTTGKQSSGTRATERPGLVVRLAEERELAVVAALFEPGLAPYRGTDDDLLLDAYLAELRDVRGRLGVSELYVAVLDAQVVGAICFYRDVALEGWSNLPVGWAGFRALVERCLERARAVGAPTLGIHTISLLADAVRLYEKLGFIRCPEFDIPAVGVFPGEYRGATIGLAFRYDVVAPRMSTSGPRTVIEPGVTT